MSKSSDGCETRRRRRGATSTAIAIALLFWAAAPAAFASGTRFISDWVNCGSTADQTNGTMAAFAAARNQAFVLLVNCPVHLNSGLAVDREIFIDSGTTVDFTPAGKFFVDNMFHPAFVIANSNQVSLLNWNVEWDGTVPIDPNFGGYYLNGRWVASKGTTQPAAAFNDLVLTKWLATNRGINFDQSKGWVKSVWVGGVNPAAVFFITGDSSLVGISGMSLYAPPGAGGSRFMPMAFSSSANWKNDQRVTALTAESSAYAAVPHNITFNNIKLDGTLMGWQGNIQSAFFFDITSKRYGDLQDANGNNVGGIGKWFPPPHLFYLNTHAADPGLANTDVSLENVNDEGVRVGAARDRVDDGNLSGYANSLKLGCSTCSVLNYISRRPDGFMDVLPSADLTVNGVYAAFDSSFVNSLYPAGIRFPSTGYSRVTFENVTLTDNALMTMAGPFGNAASSTNHDLTMSNFQIYLHNWSGSNLPLPTIGGTTNDIRLNFQMSGQLMTVAYVQNSSIHLTVKGTPTTVNRGAATRLQWSTAGAKACSAGGAWFGTLSTAGSRGITLANKGTYDFNLGCVNESDASSTTTRVFVQ